MLAESLFWPHNTGMAELCIQQKIVVPTMENGRGEEMNSEQAAHQSQNTHCRHFCCGGIHRLSQVNALQV